MSTAVIALVSFAVAFISGSMLSKAFFVTRGAPGSINRKKLHALLQAQQMRYRKRLIALNNVIGRHEEIRDQIREKVSNIELSHADQGKLLNHVKTELEQGRQKNRDLQKQLGERDRSIAEFSADESSISATEKELAMLRIERDELAARIGRMEAEQEKKAETTKAGNDKDNIARMRADMGELRETLATRDRTVHDLKVELQDSTEQAKRLQTKLDNWKQRVTPLTRKLKQQKELIQKFYRSNRRSDAENRGIPDEESGDDLKAIRGIGPALERRLQQHGIFRYEQIAELTAEELADIARKLAIAPNLAERDEWIQQARNLQDQSELCQTA